MVDIHVIILVEILQHEKLRKVMSHRWVHTRMPVPSRPQIPASHKHIILPSALRLALPPTHSQLFGRQYRAQPPTTGIPDDSPTTLSPPPPPTGPSVAGPPSASLHRPGSDREPTCHCHQEWWMSRIFFDLLPWTLMPATITKLP